tara:strand:+ start:1434 stop:1850 length:417 start_codon:yes stop_codon:yes gene_type:complete
MANKFLKFNISALTGAAGLLAQGPQLVNADDISSVAYATGTGILSIVLKGYATTAAAGADVAQSMSGRVIQIGCSNSPSAAVAPTITNGRQSPQKAVYAAMTANPGGVQSTVQLGLDNAATPVQMYFTSFTITTAVIA